MRTTSVRFVLYAFGLALAGLACTRINPEICCVTDPQCHDFGLTDHIPCAAGLTCSPTKSVCIAAECQVNDDCRAIADKPFCLAASGQCVGCLDATACPADKALCDADSHTCRGCLSDDQCTSGVCVEADGTCADSNAILWVSSTGTDRGDCSTRTAACATIPYALGKVTDTRSIIRVDGGALVGVPATARFNRAVVIDGDHTQFTTPSNGPSFAFDSATAPGIVVTIEGVRLTTSGSPQTAVAVSAGNVLRLHDVAVANSTLDSAGTLNVSKLDASTTSLTCTSGTLAVAQSTFTGSAINTMNCAMSVTQSQFSIDANAVTARGGLVTIENNVFVASSEFADAVVVGANAPGSTVAFNTLVNTATVVQSPVAITCDSTDLVTSNLLAYNSTHPLSDECTARASLFDLVGASSAGTNATGDPATFFVDRAGGDFHLAAHSPAIGIGEPGIATIDFGGHPRPARAGSRPDAGAYEAP